MPVITKQTKLNDWDEVGLEIGTLGQVMSQRDKINGEINESIALIKTEKEGILNDIEKKIKQLLLNIEEFSEVHMDEIRTPDRKHMTFSTGVIKTKLETDYDYPGDKTLVKKLKEMGLNHLIKDKPKPDKNAIKDEFDDDSSELKQLGIKVEKYISIDVEPNY